MSKILVTGATGNIGKQIAQQLIQAGQTVRVGVRNPAKARALAELGAEVVTYDFDKPDTISAAFGSIESAFLLIPFVPEFGRLGATAVEAAKAAGVKALTKLSAAGADANAPAWLPANHGASDDAVRQSGLMATVLRPTFFQDNLVTYARDGIVQQSTFYGAGGIGKVSYVSTADIAAVAARTLMAPGDHAGATYDLTGGEAFSNAELATMLSEVLGRTIRYTDMSLEGYGKMLRDAGTPDQFADAMVGLEAVKLNGWAAAVSPHVENVTGRAPETYRDFLERNKALLA